MMMSEQVGAMARSTFAAMTTSPEGTTADGTSALRWHILFFRKRAKPRRLNRTASSGHGWP